MSDLRCEPCKQKKSPYVVHPGIDTFCEHHGAGKRIAELEADLAVARSEIADLKESFGDKEETCEAIKMENANLTKQLSETQAKLTEATRESWSYWKKSYQDIAGKVNDYKQKWSSAQSKLAEAENGRDFWMHAHKTISNNFVKETLKKNNK